MRPQDESVSEWLRRLAEPRDSRAEESRRLMLLLLLGSVVGSIALFAIVTWIVGAPLILGIFVALFFLCLDAVAMAIVWYGNQRR